jgi:aryl-alcohol dehydrogenase-like predicted oxidoreductase
MAAFTELKQAGKIRFAAASNYSGARLLEAAEVSRQNDFIEYVALQNHYNLLEREEYERDSVPVLSQLGIEGLPFFGLARGFLSGKYREGVQVESVRASGVTKYTNEHGWAVLAKLDRLANHHSVSLSAIALAWLRQQPSVAAPIASARTVEQLREIMTDVTLSADEMAFLVS